MTEASEALDFERAARLPRPHPRDEPHPAASGHQSDHLRGSRCVCGVQPGRRDLHPGVLLPRRAELGQPALLPDATTASCRLDEVLESFVGQFYDEREAPKLHSAVARHSQLRAARRGAVAAAGLPSRDRRAAARARSATSCRWRCRTRASSWRAAWRRIPRSANCWKAWRKRSGWKRRPAASRCTTTPTSRARNALGAMIVAGAERLREGRIPQVQHPLDRTHARRRLRHDARGADAPLLAPHQGERGRRSESQMAQPGADRRRAGATGDRLPGVRRSRRRGRGGGRHLQGAGPRRRPRAFLHAGPRAIPPRSRRARCSISCSGCATRRTASPSAATARSAQRRIGANPLDEIGGVGASRKRALLQHFGSAKAVSAASLVDIEAVNGVSGALAKKIYDFFHPNG